MNQNWRWNRLTKKVFEDIYIDKCKQYDFLLKHKVLEDYKAGSIGALRAKLSQLNSGFLIKGEEVDNDSNTSFKDKYYNTIKQDQLTDMINSTNKNIAIFYVYKEELNQIKKAAEINNRDFYEINGSADTKEEYLLKQNRSILAIQYQSGAEGVDGLQHNTNIVIFYSPTIRGGLYKQAIKRTNRIGQTKRCIYYRFKVKDTIDDSIWDIIEQSRDYTDKLFKEEIKMESNKLDEVQNESLKTDNEDYKNLPHYDACKNLTKAKLVKLAAQLEIPGFKSSAKKEDVIREILEFNEMRDVTIKQKVELKKEEDFNSEELDLTKVKEEKTVKKIDGPVPDKLKLIHKDAVGDKPRFSYSKLMTFLTNPRDYKHKYIDKLYPRTSKGHFLLGTAAHAMIEYKNEAKVMEVLEEESPDYQEEDRDLIIKKGIMLGSKALEHLDFREGFHEVEFLVPLGENGVMRGFIDQLYELEDGSLGIGEWKTASAASSITNKVNYSVQAHAYAMAVYIATGQKPTEFNYKIMVKPRIKKAANETVEEYFKRYASQMEELDKNGNLKRLVDIKIKLDWNKVEDIWNGLIDTQNMISVCKTFPINDMTSTMFGSWDYAVLYDDMITNAEELFIKGGVK